MLPGRADALHVVGDPLVSANRVRINTLAVGLRLPTTYILRDNVEAGGLCPMDQISRASGGARLSLWTRFYAGADIPVEQPTQFDLVVNLMTAKAIGLTIPETFLLRATEVIE